LQRNRNRPWAAYNDGNRAKLLAVRVVW